MLGLQVSRRAACKPARHGKGLNFPALNRITVVKPFHGPLIASRNRKGLGCFAVATSIKDVPLQNVMEKGELMSFPDAPGVYAIFDKEARLQYVGLSRKLSVSVANHLQDLPELTHAVKTCVVSEGTRDALSGVWKAWIEQWVEETGDIPPGNMPGETKWQTRARANKAEIRLTAGKGITGITIEQLIDQVVKTNKVVAFVKGTRTQPQCGFSFKMMNMLNDSRVDYEVVNVLDDFHNPGLREAIKAYSSWPTIPQLYVSGEFLGGADIVEQMQQSGELQQALATATKQ